MKTWPIYNTMTFGQIWNSSDKFINDYKASALNGALADNDLLLLYALLAAKYKNNSISNYDIEQFKLRVYSIIWQFGPSWKAKCSLQEKARALLESTNEGELLRGTKAIYNHAYNPSSTPGTDTVEDLTYINDQNTTQYKRTRLEAYENLWQVIRVDWTESFLSRFESLFSKFCGFREEIDYEQL